MKPKFITIINDCKSPEDIGRQETRYAHLFPNTHISFVGVDSSLGINSTLESGGILIDILDASEGKPGIIALNVAPRGQVKEDGENGSKFSYFWYKKTLVVSTIKGYNLSLVKKLGLTKSINILDTSQVLDFAASHKLITKDLAEYVKNTQFRSFDFQPRVARWLFDKVNLPHTPVLINKFLDSPNAVWLIDSFGNIKTTLLFEDLVIVDSHPEFISGSEIPRQARNDKEDIATNIGAFKYYERLKLVPSGETAIYTGSSGLGNKRFLEIATQNTAGSAAKSLNLKIGDTIEIKK